jgi:hypothetical protein
MLCDSVGFPMLASFRKQKKMLSKIAFLFPYLSNRGHAEKNQMPGKLHKSGREAGDAGEDKSMS